MSAHGRFVWYDLNTTDLNGAKAFYGQLLGWGTTAMEGAAEYSMWTNQDTPIGGIMDLPQEASDAGAPPHWLAYVSVDDVEATVARAKELGGSVYVEPQQVPDTGTFAVLADPQGAAFAVWRSANPEEGEDATAPIGNVSWHELAASDYESAFKFYEALFGWSVAEVHDMGEGVGNYQIYSRRDGTPPIGGMFNKPAEIPVASWLLYIRVEDVKSIVDNVKELGGQVVNGPMEVPGGDVIAQCMDPQGAMFALNSTAS